MTLKIDGVIAGDSVDEVRGECARWRAADRRVALDVSSVRAADPRGVALLLALVPDVELVRDTDAHAGGREGLR